MNNKYIYVSKNKITLMTYDIQKHSKLIKYITMYATNTTENEYS